jgi:hypothetical protein
VDEVIARVMPVAFVALLTFVGPVMALEIYLGLGAQGEASFSDYVIPDAVAVDLEVQQPSAAAAAAVEDRLQQTLAIVAELKQARHALAQARVQARLAARQLRDRQDQEYEQQAYDRAASASLGYYGGYYGRRHPGDGAGHHKPGQGRPGRPGHPSRGMVSQRLHKPFLLPEGP